MPFTTAYSPVGNPQTSTPSGAFGGNTMITGQTTAGGPPGVTFTYIQNLASSAPLFVSFGAPVSSTQYHLVLPASGNPFIDLGRIQTSVWVSGGSFVAWSM